MQATRFCRNCKTPVNWVKVRPVNAHRSVFSCISCGGATARIKMTKCVEDGCEKVRYHQHSRCISHLSTYQRSKQFERTGSAEPTRFHPTITCKTCGKVVKLKRRPRAGRPGASCVQCRRVAKRRFKMNSLDKQAGAMCRMLGVCEAAGYVPPPTAHTDGDEVEPEMVACKGALSWAHVISRSYHRIRFWKSNCFCLCMGHHVYFTFRPLHWELFVIAKRGEAEYARLRRAAFHAPKLDRIETAKALFDWKWPAEIENGVRQEALDV